MSLLLYSAVSRNRGGIKLDKVSKEEASSFNKISAFVILVQVLLWVYFITKGVIIDYYMSAADTVALVVLGFTCLYSFFCCLVFLSTYGWNWLNVAILFTVVFISILSCIYIFDVKSSEKFEVTKTENVSAKIVSKGSWDKKDSFVLVSGSEVLTYKDIDNFTDFKNGDKVKSVSTGKLVITYRDLFNNTKVRTYDIKRFEKE